MDYERVAREWLVAVRGKRSQVAFSRRLGYKSNVVYAWEAGRRWPTAAEALRAAGRAGIDVSAAWKAFFGNPPRWLGETDPATAEGVALFLEDLRGTTTVTDLARRAGFSRYAVSRWLAARTQPNLPEFLALVEAASLRIVDLLASLVDPGSIPSITDAWHRLEARRQGAHRYPWTQAVLRTLELRDYVGLPSHRPGWIAQRIGIPPEEETRCIEFLRETDQIEWTGTHYKQRETGAVDTRAQPEVGRSLKAHWTTVAEERIRAGAPGQFSYNVFTVSKVDYERIREMHLDYYRALRTVVGRSVPGEVVAVVNVQLFALGDE